MAASILIKRKRRYEFSGERRSRQPDVNFYEVRGNMDGGRPISTTDEKHHGCLQRDRHFLRPVDTNYGHVSLMGQY